MKLRIAGLSKESVVDGPGIRYVIFAQGCLHNCRGCHNPNTHPIDGGYLVELDEIYNDIINNKFIDGVTFSGGDPFVQIDEFIELAKRLKKHNINIMCYTGYIYEDIIKHEKYKEILNYLDTLVDGKFILERKTLKKPYVGSDNQRIIDVQKSLKQNKIIEVKW
ncbi:MAG: anaerobic ribonucleoside-triphosphate reductase activating protein [Clostridiales bacterium]|nr:anaerobic ribonucleoside-triphosphate reductase activating protein [Clostridiales bacterium]